jgi:hypothetical protein
MFTANCGMQAPGSAFWVTRVLAAALPAVPASRKTLKIPNFDLTLFFIFVPPT